MKTIRLPLLFLIISASGSLTIAAERPNVVLFLVDDMGWMDSTPYGSQYYETPNMQRLAEQSMRFTDAYAVPLCSPTRASILSGQYSSRHGVTSASGHRPAAPTDASPYPAERRANQAVALRREQELSRSRFDDARRSVAAGRLSHGPLRQMAFGVEPGALAGQAWI